MGVALGTELRPISVVFCDLVGSTELSGDNRCGGIQRPDPGLPTPGRFGGPHLWGESRATAETGFCSASVGRRPTTTTPIRQWLPRWTFWRPSMPSTGTVSLPYGLGSIAAPLWSEGSGGADRKSTMAIGETLNVAARLQGKAEPGTAVASAATMSLVGGLFEVDPLGALALRGVPLPVEAFRVIRRASVRDRTQGARPVSPLVGRADELDLLSCAGVGPTRVRGPGYCSPASRVSARHDWRSISRPGRRRRLPVAGKLVLPVHPDERAPTAGGPHREFALPGRRTNARGQVARIRRELLDAQVSFSDGEN